jgi:hypothetical protein
MSLEGRSQQELARLMEKHNEGELTEKELVRFKTLLEEAQKIIL